MIVLLVDFSAVAEEALSEHFAGATLKLEPARVTGPVPLLPLSWRLRS